MGSCKAVNVARVARVANHQERKEAWSEVSSVKSNLVLPVAVVLSGEQAVAESRYSFKVRVLMSVLVC